MIEAAIFDMDGLLVDSMPLWREAQREMGVSLGFNLTAEDEKATMGLREDETVEYWYHRHPWTGRSIKDVENEIVSRVIELVKAKGKEREGVGDIMRFVKDKKLKTAVASSSPIRLIRATLEHFQLEKYFDELYSAEFEPYGKPHPAVYITAAKMLDVPIRNCIAFEDSLYGILAVKAAKMKCVCVPDEALRGSHTLSIADIVLPTLGHFNDDVWKQLDV
ncbi:MAG: hexitol phosphatase HxpB [Candidatus Paceibacterota bacterium]|jgi:sugar-phosphatase|nr:hexitol phosphatase HxpB [Candidatus Paceibacterota bacterium]